jgi:hypothetical protein
VHRGRVRPWAALLTSTLLGVAPITAAAAPPQPSSTVVVVKRPTPAPRPAPQPAPPQVAAPRAAPPLPAAPAPAPALVPPAGVSTAPSRGPRVLPWVTLAGSVAAGVAGGVFMGKAISAASEEITVEIKDSGNGTSTVSLPPEYQDQQQRILTNGVVGTVLLSAATAGAIASLISLLSD